jgi:hypothetical protein
VWCVEAALPSIESLQNEEGKVQAKKLKYFTSHPLLDTNCPRRCDPEPTKELRRGRLGTFSRRCIPPEELDISSLHGKWPLFAGSSQSVLMNHQLCVGAP